MGNGQVVRVEEEEGRVQVDVRPAEAGRERSEWFGFTGVPSTFYVHCASFALYLLHPSPTCDPGG